MDFEFTNTTFSFIATLVASIFGITYPLLMDSIRKIDEQYGSSALAAHFQTEKIYKDFSQTLLLVILVSFTASFLMLFLQIRIASIIILCFQSVLVLGLVCVTLIFFSVLMEYFTPKKLIARLSEEFKHNGTSELTDDILECVADIMVYASKTRNKKLYSESKEMFLNIVRIEQYGKDFEQYDLSDKTRELLINLTESAKNDKLTYLYNENLIAEIFFDESCKRYNGEKNFKTMWQALFIMTSYDNAEWFKQYWSSAIQYYDYFIESKQFKSTSFYKKYKDDFLELNHMLGAMLIYNGKYDLLNYILTNDVTTSNQFSLIPGTFSDIVNLIQNISTKKEKVKWSLTSKYAMQGMLNGMNNDEQILSLMYKYCALLYIRLFSYTTYKGECDKYSLSLPPVPKDSLSVFKYEEYINKLLVKIQNYWFINNAERLSKINLPNQATLKVVEDEIKKYIDKLSKKHF